MGSESSNPSTFMVKEWKEKKKKNRLGLVNPILAQSMVIPAAPSPLSRVAH